MKRFSKLIGFILVFIAVMAAFCTVSFAVTAGQTLTNPESGWQRYDDACGMINYIGTGWDLKSDYPGRYNGKVSANNTVGSKLDFKFKGTRFRIISENVVGHATNIEVFIDGNSAGQFSIGTAVTRIMQCLSFEKLTLNNSVHSVQLVNKSGGWLVLDAIDIDSDGYLLDLNLPTILSSISGNEKVHLSWDAVAGATSYHVKRSETPGGPYQTFATTTAGAITCSDIGLINGKTYYYVVSAVNTGGESQNSNEVSATPQEINQLKLVLEVREEKQLSVSDELSDNAEMDWTSFNTTIAAIDVNGRIKAFKPGNTIITCTSKDKSYTESISVLVVDLEYQLAVDLTVGGNCRLTIDDLANTANVTWSSYDTTIASVSTKGKVNAVSEGLTYILAADKDGKEIGRIYIRVR